MGIFYIGNASCLIRTREYHIGFPNAFSHYPEGMPEETREKLLSFVQDAMSNNLRSVHMDSDGVRRRIVIREGNYQVLGICAILSDFMKDPENQCNGFRDEANRPCYGFFGFVWDMSWRSFTPTTSFPVIEAFREMVETEIAPYWKAPGPLDENKRYYKNADWQKKVTMEGGFPVSYHYQVAMRRIEADWVDLNMQRNLIRFFPYPESKNVLRSAVYESQKNTGEPFSLCMNLDIDEGEASSFMNATSENVHAQDLRSNRLARAQSEERDKPSAPDARKSVEATSPASHTARPSPLLLSNEAKTTSPIHLDRTVSAEIKKSVAPQERKYQMEMKISLPPNSEYNANRVKYRFERKCLLLWRNPEGGAPYAKMEPDMGILDDLAQSVKGHLTRQRRGLYTITTAEGYSTRQLRENIAKAVDDTTAYFQKMGIRVTIKWNLLTPALEENDDPETLSVPAEELPERSAKSGQVDLDALFHGKDVTPVNDSSRPREKKGGDPFRIDF